MNTYILHRYFRLDQLRLTSVSYFLLATLALLITSDSAAQSTCSTTTLQQADRAFGFGRFSTLFSALSPCLPDGFTDKNDRIRAYRLMALSYLATDSLPLARSTIKQLLKYDSSYRADAATEPPLYVNMVNAQIPRWYTYLWRGNSATRWLARGATVGALIALPALIQSNITPDLPGHPATPAN